LLKSSHERNAFTSQMREDIELGHRSLLVDGSVLSSCGKRIVLALVSADERLSLRMLMADLDVRTVVSPPAQTSKLDSWR